MHALIAAIACWGLGCAGAASNAPTTAFEPSDVELFDNAVDLVAAPVIVEGEWGGVFERRAARADVIAAIRVQALSSELVRRRAAYRIEVKAKDWLKGSSTKELILRVSDEQPGYRTVEVNDDRVLHDSFIAFIKWEETRDGLVAHWHLSPDSSGVRDKVEYVLQRRPPDPHKQVEVVEPAGGARVTSAPGVP